MVVEGILTVIVNVAIVAKDESVEMHFFPYIFVAKLSNPLLARVAGFLVFLQLKFFISLTTLGFCANFVQIKKVHFREPL